MKLAMRGWDWMDLSGKGVNRLVEAFPESEIDGRSLLVPWTLANSRRLTALRAPSVSPIVRDYEFPGRFQPMPHQIQIADFIARNRRCYVFAEQGTGKTLASLWAIDYLMQVRDIERVLVICPLSIVRESWGDSLSKHFPHLSWSVLHGTPKKRKALATNNHDIHIINFDGVGTVRDELAANKYDLVLIDESTAVKTASTLRWKNINAIISPTAHLIQQTGTPIPQGPLDAYGQAKLTGNVPLPKTFARYRDEVMKNVAAYRWVPRDDAAEKVRAWLSPALYIAKRDVLKDLPPITYTFRNVEMSAAQKRLFEEMRKHQLAEAAGETITAVNAAVKLSKLLQVASGAAYSDDGNVVACDAGPRIHEMLDVVEQSLSKTVVYAPYRHVLEQISKALTSHHIPHSVIHGGVPLKEREAIFRSFQDTENERVLLAIPGAMAHGVTATAASSMVWFGPVSRNETYVQACARIERQGQTLPMSVVHLVSHPIERQLYEAQRNTLGYEKAVLALYQKVLKGGLKDE